MLQCVAGVVQVCCRAVRRRSGLIRALFCHKDIFPWIGNSNNYVYALFAGGVGLYEPYSVIRISSLRLEILIEILILMYMRCSLRSRAPPLSHTCSCSVLQRVAVRCSALPLLLQCVAGVLQRCSRGEKRKK